MRALRKTLSVLLLLLIIPLITAQIAAHSVRAILAESAFAKQVVRDAALAVELQGALTDGVLLELEATGTINLPRERVARLVERVLTTDRLTAIADQVIDALYLELWTGTGQPHLVIELGDLRPALRVELRAALVETVEALPVCTREQAARLLAAPPDGIPPCKTADPTLNGVLIDRVLDRLALEEQLPAQIDLGTFLAEPEGARAWADTQQALDWIRFGMGLIFWGWVVVSLLLVLLALLNLDHWSTPFGWVGAALILGSLPLLVGALGGLHLLLPLMSTYLPAGADEELGHRLATGLVGAISVAFRNTSLLIFLLGLGGVAGAIAGRIIDPPDRAAGGHEKTAPQGAGRP